MAKERQEEFFTDEMHHKIFIFDEKHCRVTRKESKKYYRKTSFGRIYSPIGQKIKRDKRSHV